MGDGFQLVFFMYGVSEINDSFAYAVGKFMGRKKIFPNISPNKTYVGFLGGIFFACLFAAAINLFVTRFSFPFTVAATVVIIGFSIIGDLVGSNIKRAVEVKDFSKIIPGSGGVLDVYDTLIFISPFIFFLSILIGR